MADIRAVWSQSITSVTLRILLQIAYPGSSEIVGGPGWMGSGPSGDRFDVNAKAATAIEEQLGLRLQPDQDEGSVLVIDHVERPTED